MTIVEIEELIKKRKEELSIEPKRDAAYQFIKKFTENNKCLNVMEFMNIDIFGLITALYYLNNRNLSYEKCREKIKTISPILLRLSSDDLSALFDIVMDIKKDGKLENVIAFLEEKKLLKSSKKLSKTYPEDFDKIMFLISLKSRKNDLDDILEFCRFIRDEDKDNRLLLELVITQREMIADEDDFNSQMDDLPINLRNKEKKRIFKMNIKKLYCTDVIMQEVSRPFKYMLDVESEEERYKRNSQRIIVGLDLSLSLLKKSALKEEITNAREIIKGIKDEDIKVAFLRFIYEHNMAYYDKLKKEISSFNGDTEAQYQAILQEHKIAYNNNLIKDIMRNSIDDLKFIIGFLKSLDLDNDNILAILINTNKDVITTVKKYFNDGCLSDDFIRGNLDILLCESEKLKLIVTNMDLIGSYGIRPRTFNDDIFLINTSLLGNNLELLKSYNLIKSLKTTNDYSFLASDELAYKIDRLLELGYEHFLENNLGLINMDNINRLEFLKALNIPVCSTENLLEVLTSKKFIVKDSEIENYILNVLPYEDFEPEAGVILEQFINTSRTYKIGNCLISSLKVKRLLDEGNSLYDSLTFGCKFSELEFESFKENLVPFKKSK